MSDFAKTTTLQNSVAATFLFLFTGVVSELFRPRWNLFLSAMNDSLVNNNKFDECATQIRVFEEVEVPFTKSTKIHLTHPKGMYIYKFNILLLTNKM